MTSRCAPKIPTDSPQNDARMDDPQDAPVDRFSEWWPAPGVSQHDMAQTLPQARPAAAIPQVTRTAMAVWVHMATLRLSGDGP